MSAERQQGEGYRQLFLFENDDTNPLRHDTRGDGGTEPAMLEEPQPLTAMDQARALTQHLMEEVANRENLNQAYRRVKANQGAPGVDGMTIAEMLDWFAEHAQEFIASLLDGSYQPQPVRGVEIPKPGGGMRQLGIPTVVDRVVQQAILQVLEPILDPTFSDSSYGFRPRRSAHQALQQASEYVAEGRSIVVDMDLEKFFDRVNHDILMSRLARRIGDKRLLKIIRRFLQAGMLQHGVWVTYYRLTAGKSHFRALDGWIRRKLRCVRLKQRKRAKSIADFLQSLGVPWNRSWTTAACGKGWWRMSHTPAAQQGMNNRWFEAQGFKSLENRYVSLQN